MFKQLPPPVFKYEVDDIEALYKKISVFEDFEKIPKIELKNIISGEDAIYHLNQALDKVKVSTENEILLIMDETPMIRDGKDLKSLVKDLLDGWGYHVKPLIIKGDDFGQVHPDFVNINKILPELNKNCAVVSLGSGVITDLSKHSTFLWAEEHGYMIPLVSCMTANTVPAYASRSSIISKDGVKRTWPSRTPDIIVMDYTILADCPIGYTIGGVGDMFPVFCSYADWYLADVLGMADFLDASWRIMDDPKNLLIPYSEKIAQREKVGMEVLAKCLTHCGLTMTFARDSVPVSGFEHVMSHLMDMTAAADGRKVGVHGQQVGVSIIYSLIQMKKMVDWLDEHADSVKVDDCFPDEEDVEKHIMSVFHEVDPSDAMGKECWSDVSIKLKNWKAARPKLEEFLLNWPTHREILKELLPFTAEECARALSKSNHPLEPADLDVPISDERMHWAFRNARFLRKRFTSSDLCAFLGMTDEAWEQDVFETAKRITGTVPLINQGDRPPNPPNR